MTRAGGARDPYPEDDTGATPPRGWAPEDTPTPPHGSVPDPAGGEAPRPSTATGSFVAPGSWTQPSGVPRAADRRARARRTAGRTSGRPTPPSGFPTTRQQRPDRLATTRRRLVAVARVLAGGLVVLAVVVIVAPWLLGGPGPGADTVIGHLVGAAAAVAATALGAHRRTRPVLAVVAAAAVPVILVLVLGLVWWR